MKLLPLRWLIGCALIAAIGASPVFAHLTDLAPGPPTTYTGAVQRVRETMRGVEEARERSDFPDASLHAGELVVLARQVPALSLSVASALADSAVGRIMLTSTRVGALALAAQQAADRKDAVDLGRQTAEFAALLATLDAYVPKQYVCPMHCEVGRLYDRPGSCPVCGMFLQLVTSDRYSVEVTPKKSPIRARSAVTLDFRVKDPAGFDATRFQVVHEKPLHLMIVSYDLSQFDHVHPTLGPDGRFQLRHAFPSGGRYVLFHDFTPDSVGMQVVPVELAVEGAERPRVALTVDDDQRKRVDGVDVTLSHSPLLPGADCTMTFTLERRGKPVTDLEPFLGAMGHLVMVSEDRGSFVHSHPLEQKAVIGPSVTFNMRFERTGLYKAWGQFQRRGRVITVPFVVRISADGRGGNDPLGGASAER